MFSRTILQLQQKCKILIEFFCENGQGISAVVIPVTISLNIPQKARGRHIYRVFPRMMCTSYNLFIAYRINKLRFNK